MIGRLVYLLVGAMVGTVIYSCAMGGKPIDYDKVPEPNKDNSVYMKCLDGDKEHACKNVCLKYDKKNVCKEFGLPDKVKIRESLDNGWVMMSNAMFVKLLKGE
jgi:hypothetical protein